MDLLACLGEPPDFREEVSANTVKQMIASQRRVSSERGDGIECIKPPRVREKEALADAQRP